MLRLVGYCVFHQIYLSSLVLDQIIALHLEFFYVSSWSSSVELTGSLSRDTEQREQ